MTTRFAALVAAAGMSSRMRKFKPLLPFDGLSIIEHVVEKFIALGAAPVVVVTGCRHDLLAPVVQRAGATVVYNRGYADTGMFESLALGLKHLAGKCDAVFIQPCDIPLVEMNTLGSLKETLCARECMAVRPVHRGRGGHPVLFSGGAVPYLLRHDGRGGLREAMRTLPGQVIDMQVDDPGVLMDADCPEDYEALLRNLEFSKMAGCCV